jgi:hypothetical protein
MTLESVLIIALYFSVWITTCPEVIMDNVESFRL